MNDNTPEQVALELLKMIANVEQKDFMPPAGQNKSMADRAWILQTYAECLRCVREPKSLRL